MTENPAAYGQSNGHAQRRAPRPALWARMPDVAAAQYVRGQPQRPEQRQAAEGPQPDLDERVRRLEAANAELRQNNAALVADQSVLKEQNTALQQANYRVRKQNVDLHDQNQKLAEKVDQLFEVLQAHSVLLNSQNKSIGRHDSTLAGFSETLASHENTLRRLDRSAASEQAPGGQDPKPTFPVGQADSRGLELNARAYDLLDQARQSPSEPDDRSNDYGGPGIDPWYNPDQGPGGGMKPGQ